MLFFTVGHDFFVTMTQDVITTAIDFATAVGGASKPEPGAPALWARVAAGNGPCGTQTAARVSLLRDVTLK